MVSVWVRKGNAAVLVGSGLSVQPKKTAQFATSEGEKEFVFVVFTAACDRGPEGSAPPRAAAVLCSSSRL